MTSSILERAVALVVDDHPETLQLLIDALEEAQVTVLVATDGRGALDAVERLVPDVILLDAVLPGMDGFETCRALKRGAAADVPVIFMTGLEETEHVVRGLEAGGIDYLTKPIAPDELLARMRVHLSNARSAQGARAALDVSGRTLLAVSAQGSVRWGTPQARRMLAKLAAARAAAAPPSGPPAETGRGDVELPPEVRVWLSRRAANAAEAPNAGMACTAGSLQVRFRVLSRVSEDEVLLVMQQADPVAAERDGIAALQKRFGLTLREAEVLYWLSRGKSNRNIAEILGMSYRTVDKHLEHVYPKIGVESRSGAIAASVRVLEE